MLIVLSGRPGVGKTTISRELGRALGAAVLRVDVIESAVIRSGLAVQPIGPIGYVVANDVARGCLCVGTSVIIDAVNPVPEARAGWAALADEVAVVPVMVEVVLRDRAEHRRRVEARTSDVDSLVVPAWAGVLGAEYVEWDEARDGARLVVDGVDSAVAAAAIIAQLDRS
ncbi:MAG: AAA family ATPase [Jatrophihabitantaceae bacterium]